MKVTFSAVDYDFNNKEIEYSFDTEGNDSVHILVEHFNMFLQSLGYVNNVDVIDGDYYDNRMSQDLNEMNDAISSHYNGAD